MIRPECTIASHLSSLADVHLVAKEICGAIFLQGIKPKTLLNAELHTGEEGSEIKLTPRYCSLRRRTSMESKDVNHQIAFH